MGMRIRFEIGCMGGYAGAMQSDRGQTPRRSSWTFLLLLLTFGLAMVGQANSAILFHSPTDDGAEPLTVPILPGSPEERIYLYLDAGPGVSSLGTPCADGEGDEICAWEFELSATGPASVQSFIPDPGRDVVWRTTASGVSATGGDATQGEIGPLRIGEIVLAVAGSGWQIEVAGGNTVDSGFGLEPLPAGVLAVPEPAAELSWIAGVLLLGALLRRRSRPRVVIFTGIAALAAIGAPPADAQDSDLDGITDAIDNCVFVANPGQEDAGGLLGPPADGIGDACQCGDLNADGQVDLLDAAIYQRDLAGLAPEASNPEQCSVVGGRLDCEPNDELALREALVGIAPGVGQVCEAAVGSPPLPSRMAAAGDSITQGFAADCTCNAGFLGLICLLCPAGGDQGQHSWFNGGSLGGSFEDKYGVGSGITATRVSVSGAQMRGGADSFANQADDLLALIPMPELVVVELGGNDICNRGCVEASSCTNSLYTGFEWETAVRAGLDKLVGFNHPNSLAAGATVYLLGVPRVHDLRGAGVALQQSSSTVDCESFWDSFNVCEIATLDITMSGETLPTRLDGIAARVQLYNEILRDLALEYSTNATNRNPLGIEVVADYVNESTPSIGTTSFGAAELNGGDCFHPSLEGQRLIATGAWSTNPRQAP